MLFLTEGEGDGEGVPLVADDTRPSCDAPGRC